MTKKLKTTNSFDNKRLHVIFAHHYSAREQKTTYTKANVQATSMAYEKIITEAIALSGVLKRINGQGSPFRILNIADTLLISRV